MNIPDLFKDCEYSNQQEVKDTNKESLVNTADNENCVTVVVMLTLTSNFKYKFSNMFTWK